MIENIPFVNSLTSLIIFEIADKEFAADLKDISAIINPFDLEQSYKSSIDKLPFIKINDLIIHLVDLQKYLGTHEKISERMRIISFENDNKSFGLIVHRIKEILTVSDDLKTKLEFLSAEGEPYLLGRLFYEGRSLLIPNLQFLSVKK
ncbi:MAG: chemotaxis protein CheW [Bacteroidota bacterium]|nr:chemotaxis protein CheW [Bacteroidota bacterium]